MTTASERIAMRDEVLAFFAAGNGYKRCARAFNLPVSTVKDWVRAERKSAEKGAEVPARARARANPDAKPVGRPGRSATPPTPSLVASLDSVDLEDWDPATCTREEYLAQAIRRAHQQSHLASEKNHGNVAKSWSDLALKLRGELDALVARREAEDAAKRHDVGDPGQRAKHLVRGLTKSAEALVRLDERGCRRLAAALQRYLPDEAGS